MNRLTILLLGGIAVLIPGLTTAVILADLSPEARAEVTETLGSQVAVLAVGLVALVAAVVGVSYTSYRSAKRRDESMAAEIDMLVSANPSHRLVPDSATARAVNELASYHQSAEERLAEQLEAAHEELRDERDALIDVLAGLDVPVGVVDAQGRILLVNPAARSRLQGGASVAAGRSIYSVFDAHDFAPLLAEAAAGGQPTARVGDVTLRLVRISAPLDDEGGATVGATSAAAAAAGTAAEAAATAARRGPTHPDPDDIARILIIGDAVDSRTGDAAGATGIGAPSGSTGHTGGGDAPALRLSSDLGRRRRPVAVVGNWLDTPLEQLVFTVVDCETTGLHVEAGDKLVAVAAVRIDRGHVRTEDTFDMLTNPGRPIPEVSREIHGISDDMVAGAPPTTDVVAAFARYADDSVLVGHHLGFDVGFLRPVASRAGAALPEYGLDTMLLSAVLFTAADTHHGLDALCGRLGVPIIGRHTALGDSLATAEALVRMMPMLAARGITTLGQARAAADQTTLAKRIASA